MKTCTKCNEQKPEDMFRLSEKSPDGYTYWCKKCLNKYTEDFRKKDAEAYKARDRAKYARRMVKLHGEGYVVGDPKNLGREAVLDSETKRIRHNARRVTRRAIDSGKLVKQPCQRCGDSEVQAHHTDYLQPLEVMWLCDKHHREIHQS